MDKVGRVNFLSLLAYTPETEMLKCFYILKYAEVSEAVQRIRHSHHHLQVSD